MSPPRSARCRHAALFASDSLNVWSGPGERFKRPTVLTTAPSIQSPGLESGQWTQIVHRDRFVWVNSAYVVKNKPTIEPEVESDTVSTKSDADVSTSVTEAPCRLGSGVEAGLTSDAVRVYRSVCAEFPQVTSYGGVRSSDGEHGTGQALDIMATGSLGDAIAAYVRANAAKLGVSEVLWAQQIWTVAARRRRMAERSPTAAQRPPTTSITCTSPFTAAPAASPAEWQVVSGARCVRWQGARAATQPRAHNAPRSSGAQMRAMARRASEAFAPIMTTMDRMSSAAAAACDGKAPSSNCFAPACRSQAADAARQGARAKPCRGLRPAYERAATPPMRVAGGAGG